MRRIRDVIKRFELPLYFVAAVLGIYLAVAGILRAAKYPNEATWAFGTFWFWAMVVAAVFVPLYALYKAIDAFLQGRDKEAAEADEKVRQLQADLQLVCQRVVAAVADGCPNVDVNDLGAQVWLCRADDIFDRRAWFFLPEARKRSGIEWRKGKGVAGTAWRLNKDLRADLTPLQQKLDELGAARFDQLDEDARYGMGASEMESTRDYTGICAVRLFSQSQKPRLLGMFVLDYMGPQSFGPVADQVVRRPVTTSLGGCEKVLTDAEAILPA
jgi:hypothetical protein